ncbi:MAG: sigma-70 family RNA polymerase sigma factor [Acidobacteriota bacterium]|nr:sigma-70 family RNA polymerase sigma factor [Acidobacteriota bacterium]
MARPSEFGDDALGHIDALYSTARRLTKNPAEAEDLVQDTYLKAFRARSGFRPGSNLRAWLFAILHNTFLNDIRRRKASPVVAGEAAVEYAADRHPAPGPTPEDRLMAQAAAADVDAALAGLPDAYRQAVWLRDVQEMPYAEIAGILQIPMGTVMSRIARGRKLLHDGLVEIQNAAPGVKAKGT